MSNCNNPFTLSLNVSDNKGTTECDFIWTFPPRRDLLTDMKSAFRAHWCLWIGWKPFQATLAVVFSLSARCWLLRNVHLRSFSCFTQTLHSEVTDSKQAALASLHPAPLKSSKSFHWAVFKLSHFKMIITNSCLSFFINMETVGYHSSNISWLHTMTLVFLLTCSSLTHFFLECVSPPSPTSCLCFVLYAFADCLPFNWIDFTFHPSVVDRFFTVYPPVSQYKYSVGPCTFPVVRWLYFHGPILKIFNLQNKNLNENATNR